MNGGQKTATNGSGGGLVDSDYNLTGAVGQADITATDTSLKCLEEPSFEFEASKEAVAKKNEAAINPAVKKPSYRVLEDPFEAPAPSAATTSAGGPVGGNNTSGGPARKAPNYRVLEDPMTTAMYDPSTSSEVGPNSAVAAVAGSSRPPASEVLEGAREKFDKFWGSKTRNNTSDSTTNNEP